MRFTLPYNLYRFMGITGLFLVLYIVVIGVFGKVDITPLMPVRLAATIEEGWPQLPIFVAEKEPTSDGKGQEIYYTVPARQLTPQEVARMGRVPAVGAVKDSGGQVPPRQVPAAP